MSFDLQLLSEISKGTKICFYIIISCFSASLVSKLVASRPLLLVGTKLLLMDAKETSFVRKEAKTRPNVRKCFWAIQERADSLLFCFYGYSISLLAVCLSSKTGEKTI